MTNKRYEFDNSKPSAMSRIGSTVIAVGSVATETTLPHKDIVLDLRTRRVSAAGIDHDLTAREFTMLEFFLRHAGQVLSREQILSRVWGFDHDPGSNVVDVYIRYLRQKLGNDSIQTVRGMGYRLG